MTQQQRTIVWITAGLLAGMCFYPPWRGVYEMAPLRISQFVGYHPLWEPDALILSRWTNEYATSGGSPETHGYAVIDAGRLLLQGVIVLALGLAAFLHSRRPSPPS
jgi:hypothetical protein